MSSPLYLVIVGILFLAFALFRRTSTFPFLLIPSIICFVWAGVAFWRRRRAVMEGDRRDSDPGPPELMGRNEIERKK